MKKIFTIIAMIVTVVTVSAQAQNYVNYQKLYLNGQTYDVTGYIFRDGFNGVIKASWTHVIEAPHLSGDWEQIFLVPGGYGMKLGKTCYVFNKHEISSFESDTIPESWTRDASEDEKSLLNCSKVNNFANYADFDTDAITAGKECGYVYVSDCLTRKQHVIVYGN